MARSRKYRKNDRNFVSKVIYHSGSILKKTGHFFVRVFKIFDQKLTLMIVPHSQGKVFNLRTNVFALVLGILVVTGIAASFIYFNRVNLELYAKNKTEHEEHLETQANLDELRSASNDNVQVIKRVQKTLSQFSPLSANQTNQISSATSKNSDLSSLFDTQDITSGTLKEVSDLRQATSYLESTIQPLEQIGKMLENQNTLFTDIPNIWPIKNGIGHISMKFGQTIHPIKQQWYIHKGLDFSTWRSGDPVVATANGQIVTVGYDDSFGNYIIIKHKHGIYTRYAHLSVVRVAKGDSVTQRQIIGNIGNTGMSTGPHLHYEVHIGSDVVDPSKYINIK